MGRAREGWIEDRHSVTSRNIIIVPRRRPPRASLQRVARWLGAGNLVVLPSETQYALSGDATRPDVIASARALKGRDRAMPFSAFFANRDALDDWGIHIPSWAESLTRRFWPGPLTLVLPMRNRALKRLGSAESVGVRVSSEPFLTALTGHYGKPLLATSANPSGEHFVPDQENKWLDGIVTSHDVRWVRPARYVRRPASTVLDCTGKRPHQLRAGAVPETAWRAVLRDS